MFKRVARFRVAGIALGMLLMLVACARQVHSFQGSWVVPGDGARRLTIGAHEGSFINAGSGHIVKMRYTLRSPTEAAFIDDKGKTAIVCDLSEDGDSLQMFVQKPFGNGVYSFQRLP